MCIRDSSVTLWNLNRLSKCLHCWKAYKIFYKTHTTWILASLDGCNNTCHKGKLCNNGKQQDTKLLKYEETILIEITNSHILDLWHLSSFSHQQLFKSDTIITVIEMHKCKDLLYSLYYQCERLSNSNKKLCTNSVLRVAYCVPRHFSRPRSVM